MSSSRWNTTGLTEAALAGGDGPSASRITWAAWGLGRRLGDLRAPPAAARAHLPTQSGTYLAVVDPGQASSFGLLAGHPVNPPISRTGWLREARLMTDEAATYAGARLVVIGDLNSTLDHVTIRRMRDEAGFTRRGRRGRSGVAAHLPGRPGIRAGAVGARPDAAAR